MVTGATERHDMVTRATEEVRNGLDIVTAVQEEIPYCSSGISSGNQKKARFTSQPQFRSENTPATNEADQILLALQQLATNSSSANFNNNISRISKLLKSLTTTMPTFDGKSEKFELFDDLFQTIVKNHNQLTEEDKIYHFHSLMRGDALQTFKNIDSPNRKNLTENLTVFRKKYVKPQSMATAKHKFQQIVFNPVNQKLIDFLDELQKLAKKCFRSCCPSNHWPIHICQDASTPEEINKPGPLGERHIWTDCDTPRNETRAKQFGISWLNSEEHCDARTTNWRQQRKDNAENINSDTNNSNPNNNKKDRKSRTVCPICETSGKTKHSTERCYIGANAANRPLPWKNKPQE